MAFPPEARRRSRLSERAGCGEEQGGAVHLHSGSVQGDVAAGGDGEEGRDAPEALLAANRVVGDRHGDPVSLEIHQEPAGLLDPEAVPAPAFIEAAVEAQLRARNPFHDEPVVRAGFLPAAGVDTKGLAVALA